MTRIQSIDGPSDHPKLSSWRTYGASELGNYSSLGARPWDELSRFQIFPGVELGDALLVMPERWLPSGPSRLPGFRTLNPTLSVSDTTESVDAIRTRDEHIRRMLLALWLPRASGPRIAQYSPSSWLNMSRLLLKMVAWQVQNRPSRDGRVWTHLSVQDIATLQHDVVKTKNRRSQAASIIRTLAEAGSRGYISDFPLLKDRVQIGNREASNKGPENSPQRKLRPRVGQPFSDQFVGEFLWRGLWLQREIAVALLDCWTDLRQIESEALSCGDSVRHPKWVLKRRLCVRNREWRDSHGNIIDRLPFLINQRIQGKYQRSDIWPPEDSNTIRHLVGVLQTMNVSVVAFCTGARLSEIASATDESLVDSDNPKFVARTFKLVDERDGQIRDWPLHPAAARALQIQADLARRIRPPGTNHLWVLAVQKGIGPRGYPLQSLTGPLKGAVRQLGLEHLCGDAPAHLHRWRHTIARLVALSIIGSPQVIYDLFGHRDLEMTLRYMLSSPDIMKDTVRISKEVVAAQCEEAVKEAAAGNASGSAAIPLREGLRRLQMQRGEDVFESTSLRDLTEILTDNGRRWEIVRPGVICTKAPGQFGPCTQGRGMPDPGSCRTTCDHRLETSRAKAQCDAVIGTLVTETKAAIENGLEMVAENLKGQLLANLHRWDDLRDAWIARDAVAASVWEERRHG